MSLIRMFLKMARTGIVTENSFSNADKMSGKASIHAPIHATINSHIDSRSEQLRQQIHDMFGGSLHIRHLDSGSCNGCDWELATLLNPYYDLQRFGIDFVASPRHADMILATGGVTRHLAEAVEKTWAATPPPKILLAVGDCAIDGGVFGGSYAHFGGLEKLMPVCIAVPGCPPRPQAIIDGILQAIDRLKDYSSS